MIICPNFQTLYFDVYKISLKAFFAFVLQFKFVNVVFTL